MRTRLKKQLPELLSQIVRQKISYESHYTVSSVLPRNGIRTTFPKSRMTRESWMKVQLYQEMENEPKVHRIEYQFDMRHSSPLGVVGSGEQHEESIAA